MGSFLISSLGFLCVNRDQKRCATERYYNSDSLLEVRDRVTGKKVAHHYRVLKLSASVNHTAIAT